MSFLVEEQAWKITLKKTVAQFFPPHLIKVADEAETILTDKREDLEDFVQLLDTTLGAEKNYWLSSLNQQY